LSTALFIRSPD